MISLPYIAGFVDGEGCIQFTRCRSSVYPRVLVVNTNREILDELKARFGGDISPLHIRKTGWKQGWIWRLSWSAAVTFLDRIQPFLRLKCSQAETVFAWDSIRPWSKGKWDQPSLDLLMRRMSWLNKKGDVIGDDPIEAVVAMSKAGKARKKKKK